MKTEHKKTGIGTGLVVTVVVVIVLIAAAGYFIFFPSTTTTTNTTTSTSTTSSPTTTSKTTTTTSTTPTSTSTTTTSTTTTSTTTSSTTSPSTTTTSSSPGPTQKVYLPAGVGASSSLNFNPSTFTVTPGTTIEFINNDTTSIHNVYFLTMPTGATISPNPSPNSNTWTNNVYSLALTVAGTYTYECQYHNGWMHGTITVSSSTSSTSASTSSSSSISQAQKVYLPSGVGAESTLNFNPSTFTITRGTPIEFINNDTTSIHNVYFLTMPTGATISPNPSPNSNTWTNNVFTVTLTVPGTYTYECQYHNGWMHGTITVT